MIDVSPLLLWPAADVLELMPLEGADNPQARRLAVVVAEAHSAGKTAAVLGWFCDVGRLLLLHAPSGRAALLHAISASEAVALRGEPVPSELVQLLRDLCEIKSLNDPAEIAAATIAGWAVDVVERTPLAAEQAWRAATDLLAAVVQMAGTSADAAIVRSAELAHERLFGRNDCP